MPGPRTKPADDAPPPLRFEEALEQLEALIDRIESGETGLEDALAAHAEGVKLIAHCRGILDAADRKLAELTVGDDDALSIREADDADEEPA